METSKTGFVMTKPILTNLSILHTRIRNNDLVLIYANVPNLSMLCSEI